MKLTPELQVASDKIEQKFSSKNGVFTLGDAASLTGLSLRDSKDVLDSLIGKYDCRLKVTEHGDLIYDFGRSPHRRGERTWEEWWRGAQKTLWNIFVFTFKICIAATLVIYFVVFLVILIAFIIAMISANSSSDSDSGGDSAGGIFDFVGEMFRTIFIWNTVNNNHSYHYNVDSNGYSYRSYDDRGSVLNKISKKKSKDFVASVYDFVFGPPRIEMHPLENQKEVAAYLRQQRGIIVTPELIGLAGWTNAEAQDFFSHCIARFDGDAAISENAVLYGDFGELIRGQNKEGDSQVVWYWDEYEPEYKLTGNSFWRNFGVVSMNLFNLVSATILLSLIVSGEAGLQVSQKYETIVFILLGWVPFLFSATFFAVPILRFFYLIPKRSKRNYENARKRLMKAIFTNVKNGNTVIPLSRLLDAVNSQNKNEVKLSDSTVQNIMKNLLYDLEGEVDLSSNGQMTYKFDQLALLLNEAEELRKKRVSGIELGNIVFDSED